MRRIIILLRGINVSGHNKVPMAELRTDLDTAGFANVATYIQSGNIAVDSDRAAEDVADAVEHVLAESFDVHVPVVVVDQETIQPIIDTAPFAPDVNPAFQLIYFADGVVDVDSVGSMDCSRWPNDTITASANAVYVSFRDGQSTSKLTIDQLERAAGTTLTGRNLRSSAKLATL